ncbi:MAG: cation:proton antiporter, partial [Methylococcales bacterium]|nr:cation:proton antiporter [Methylococcales bacterium]
IGVLVVQDVFAVLFLGISEAKMPSVWAAFLITLIIIARPFLYKVLNKSGHGELQILYGLVLALGGASLFEAVDLKADLGALVFGALLANHTKSQELAKALFSIKELFLLGFFLSIGMAGFPDNSILLVVAILLPFLLIKTSLFFLLFTQFKVRTGPATTTSIGLGNYSEFGLIVTTVAVSHQWVSQEWVIVMAVLVASSFAVSSAANNYTDNFYTRFSDWLDKFQRSIRLKGDEDIDLSGIQIIVCGMGRVGTGAYDQLIHQGEKHVHGLDSDEKIVLRQCKSGRKASTTDVSSPDFWSRLDIKNSEIKWILLCTSNVHANAITANLARQKGFKGFISSTTHYPDEDYTLTHAGVDAVFNIYAEAGVGLVQQSEEIINFLNSNKDSNKDSKIE